MKQFYSIPFDLYVSKDDVKKMEQGAAGVGYATVNNPNDYELIPGYAFQPITNNHILSSSSYSVVFIGK